MRKILQKNKLLYDIVSSVYGFFYRKRLDYIEGKNNFNANSAFLIFSDPRGGSTWLTELLKLIPETAVIWEPLNIAENNSFKKLGFGWRQQIPVGQRWPEAKDAFANVFMGKELNKTTVYFEKNNLRNYHKSNNLIVKFVNGNTVLPWLCNEFEFKYKPIFLIRHPFSVVSSQLKHGAWNHVKDVFEIPDIKFNDEYKRHSDFLNGIKTLDEKLTATWCITNLPTLRSSKNNIDWIAINYEQLVINPIDEISRIFNCWGIKIPSEMKNKLHRPSITTKEGSPITGKNQLSQWKRNLDSKQIERMTKVLEYFEVEFYKPNQILPIEIFF